MVVSITDLLSRPNYDVDAAAKEAQASFRKQYDTDSDAVAAVMLLADAKALQEAKEEKVASSKDDTATPQFNVGGLELSSTGYGSEIAGNVTGYSLFAPKPPVVASQPKPYIPEDI